MVQISRIQNNPRKKKMKESLNITRMLILVVTVFLIVEVPVMIITMLHALSTEEKPLLDYTIAETLVLIINCLTCLSSPINLAIYCGTSKLFRDTFRSIFMSQTSSPRVETQETEV